MLANKHISSTALYQAFLLGNEQDREDPALEEFILWGYAKEIISDADECRKKNK